MDDVALVTSYVEAAQAARSSGSEDDWARVRAFLHDDVVVRRAGDGSGAPWMVVAETAEAFVDRLSRPAVSGARLRTTTVAAFGSDGRVVVEQLSSFDRPDDTKREKPVCFVFEVRDGRIASISLYRNDGEHI